MSSESETFPAPDLTGRFEGRRVAIIVTGGIAAYKTCILVRELIRAGAEVQVMMSRSGAEFVTPLTFATLSGRPVHSEMFPTPPPADPIHLFAASWADVLVVAPATANFIAKLAHGLADDLPSASALAFRKPILLAPAMNPGMWNAPAVEENIGILRRRGIQFVGPETGGMGGVHEKPGPGRMSEPAAILDRLEEIVRTDKSLAGRKIIVTSGPTRERIDPVRYISNYSSGKMGDAIAREAYFRGGEVTLVRGNASSESYPDGVELINIESAAQMMSAVNARFEKSDILIMAAAVADWKPAVTRSAKTKKENGPLVIDWVETEDILAWAGKTKKRQVVIGFALETADHLASGMKKLTSKGADMIVLNDPTRSDSAFGGDTTRLTLLRPGRSPEDSGLVSKTRAARLILDKAETMLSNA